MHLYTNGIHIPGLTGYAQQGAARSQIAIL